MAKRKKVETLGDVSPGDAAKIAIWVTPGQHGGKEDMIWCRPHGDDGTESQALRGYSASTPVLEVVKREVQADYDQGGEFDPMRGAG